MKKLRRSKVFKRPAAINEKQSSDKLASKAAKTLRNEHASALAKSLAGSVLSQARSNLD